MANRQSQTAGAPTYDRAAIDSATASPTLAASERDRVVAAVRLGWEIEELVARSYLLDEPQIAPTREIPGTPGADTGDQSNGLPRSLFVPDLFHAQSPDDRLQSVVTIVRAQPALMFPGRYPLANHETADASRSPGPAKALFDGLQQAIDQLSGQKVIDAVGAIDQALVNILLDPTYSGETGAAADPICPLLLSGYEVGKALGGTRWVIWAAHMLTSKYEPDQPPPKADRVKPAWSQMFDSGRIATIQRHLGSLTSVFGGRVTMAVSKSLDYWRAALLDPSLLSLSPPSHEQANRSERPVRSEWTHAVATRRKTEIDLPLTDQNLNQEIVLFAALRQQVDAWYDLLTLRRNPEDFPITGVISSVLGQLAAQQFKSATAVFTPLLRGAGLVFAILVAVVIIVLALALALLPAGTSQQVTAGGVVALGSGLVGTLAALLTGRSGMSANGQTTLNDLQDRVRQLEQQTQQRLISARDDAVGLGRAVRAEADSTPPAVHAAIGPWLPQSFSWQGVVQSVATDVVNQLRLEEIYLGVSEPLARYVLAPAAVPGSEVIADPHAAARKFLSLIYESTPNIERLSGVLTDLYRAAATGNTASPESPPSPGVTPLAAAPTPASVDHGKP